MMKKLLVAGLTAGALAVGMAATTAPANAQVFFGFGVGGPGYYHHGWGPGYGYRPHYGYYRPAPRCGWVIGWRHHHRVRVWRCW